MSDRKPICSHCNDTHSVSFEDDAGQWVTQMCNHCPVPCQKCRAGGNGPYCETTPCPCACHRGGDRKPIMCGGVQLVDDHGFGWVGAFGELLLQVASFEAKRFEWVVSHAEHSGRIEPKHDYDTPEAAAEDLAKFLGELHEATRGFGEGKE